MAHPVKDPIVNLISAKEYRRNLKLLFLYYCHFFIDTAFKHDKKKQNIDNYSFLLLLEFWKYKIKRIFNVW